MGEPLDDALNILGEWRSSHTIPLQVVYMALRERARRVSDASLVSQRLKRVPSIVAKLTAKESMALARMQDIGGCRAVLPTIDDVRSLAAKYDHVVHDYISRPKEDGYRSIHIVESYQPTSEKYQALAGRLIEIQLRTKLQHAWATAVETVDSLIGQNLKGGGGNRQWRRFFALASSVLAAQEGCKPIPGTPEDPRLRDQEIREIARRLNVISILQGLSASVHRIQAPRQIAAYVLVLDLKKRSVRPYPFSNQPAAAKFYLDKEKEHYRDRDVQVVQVKVSTLRELRKAYPNYYLNAQAFLTAMKKVLSAPLD